MKNAMNEPRFIVPPQGVLDMLELIRNDDFNQRVKNLAYQRLEQNYGLDKAQADALVQQK
ncbi:hypothetical protein D1Z90_11955 [Motilimonas pumila]|uniref:Uncharacterized protein n=2 Tax=Motilimonas pumila TaxID=2303987 RepID=A0A418YE18_9GAMM|nr:hypothetical protein D1Z90_11955 [Motilimonas pumila]